MRSVERPAISAAIAEARDKGDLSENAEYDAAREAQGLLEMRIAKMENTLANARIIDESKIDKSKVQILSKVTLLNHNTKKQVVYTIVAEHEANLREGKLAIGTPIAKALLGHKKGDVVTVEVPAGRSTSKSSTSTSDRGVADETENPLGRSARNVSSYAGSLKKRVPQHCGTLFCAHIAPFVLGLFCVGHSRCCGSGFRHCNPFGRCAFFHAFDTDFQIGMCREQLVQLAALAYSGLLFHLFQPTERQGHRPWVLAGVFQKFVAVIIRIAFLLLRIVGIHQRFAQVAQL